MVYLATDGEIAMLSNPRYQSGDVGAYTGPDRFRCCYTADKEASVMGFKYSHIDEVCEDLEAIGYRVSDRDFDMRGFTYRSPDGKTEVFVDEVMGMKDDITRVLIIRGQLSDDELTQGEKEAMMVFDSIYGKGVILDEDSFYRDALKRGIGVFGYGFGPDYRNGAGHSFHTYGRGAGRPVDRPEDVPKAKPSNPFSDGFDDIYKQMEEDMKMPDLDMPDDWPDWPNESFEEFEF